MDFGKPSLFIREPFEAKDASKSVKRIAATRTVVVQGEWSLWLRICFWKLTSKGEPLARLTSSDRKIDQAIRWFKGEKLTSVEIHPQTGATRFHFDLGCLLECRRLKKDSADELWCLQTPQNYFLSVYGDGTFEHRRSDKPAIRLAIEQPR